VARFERDHGVACCLYNGIDTGPARAVLHGTPWIGKKELSPALFDVPIFAGV
jgi:hypothetical protein